MKLRSYSGHEIGEAKVQVSYGDQQGRLPVIVTAGDGLALMGRNWLFVLRLDWKQIKQISLEPNDEVLDAPEYPMPTAEKLFTQLNGGEKFIKLDLSSAYQKVLLDEESRQYVPINAHLGLYRYTRLPFGVAASPAIFEQTMDSITALMGLVASWMI